MKVSLDLRLFVEEDPAVTRREALAELGLAPSASDEDVKARWRDLVKVWQQETGGSDAEEIERLILARDAARSKGPCGPYLPWRGAHSPGAHSPRECAAGARPFAPKTPLRRIEPTHDISHRAFSPNYGKPRCGGPICGNRSAAPPRGSAVSRRGGDGNTKPIPVGRAQRARRLTRRASTRNNRLFLVRRQARLTSSAEGRFRPRGVQKHALPANQAIWRRNRISAPHAQSNT